MSSGNRSTPSDGSDRSDQRPDPVEAYLAAYVDAVDRGEEPPSLDHLDAETRAEAAELLALLAATDQDPAPAGADAEPGAVPGAEREVEPDVEPEAGRRGDAGRASGGRPGALRPRAESRFALAHGFVRPAPDVVVVGAAVRQAREAAGLAVADVSADMRRRGAAIEVAELEAMEAEDRPASRLPPREARLLAAVLGLPLTAIEAKAEPWPADPRALGEIRQEGVEAVVLGEDVVVRTARGDHLGVLRCPGDADLLDSRTYREAAAALLTGPWSYLAGALLVAGEAPHLALAVDALDCVTRWHAPTGSLGFTRLAEPEPLADAVASYDRTYTVRWSDPHPLDGNGDGPAGSASGATARLGSILERLGAEARRSRQPGKRPGYEAAARWLEGVEGRDLVALLDDLADLPADTARAWLDEQLAGEVVVT